MRTRSVTLASRPSGEPRPDNLVVTEIDLPDIGAGQVLTETLWLSLDPYMRGQMDEAPATAPTIALGAPMRGETVGRVLASRNAAFNVGDLVIADAYWQEHVVSDTAELRRAEPQGLPLSTLLGVLGMPGRTAYFGLIEIARPKTGDTLVVAAAAGPVGSLVGQIGKRLGCRVVGIAGGSAKCRYLREGLGLDVAIDHRAAHFEDHLRDACPDGIDVYFENVGGRVWAAVFPLLNRFARVAVCGLAAHYNQPGSPPGPDRLPELMRSLTRRRLTLQGFNVDDFSDRTEAFVRDVGGWLRRGEIIYREDIADGLDRAPARFAAMLRGETFGKTLIRIKGE